MRIVILAATFAMATLTPALAQQKAVAAKPVPAPVQRLESGLIQVPSALSVKDTIDRLAKAVEAKGAKVVAQVDHAAGAKAAGVDMKPSELLIFGNPKLGTPVMEGNVRAGLDLPLKMLAYEDAAGKVWLTYLSPNALRARYRVFTKDSAALFETMTAVMADVAKTATTK